MALQYAVAVVGGATAGAETARMLAERGAVVVVIEQNLRPYGKIEDGLPRWHAKLRLKEYESVNQKLDHPNIHFVPLTKVGRDIDFRELATEWGFTAVILALGAWRDRPLPIDGVDDYVGRGLIYQNAFIHWFNHCEEADYRGPHYDVPDGAAVIGGGLASIDVIKVMQIETTRRALERRGIRVDALHIEHVGIDAALSEHGLQWADLGMRGATLFYRRRVEDMPVTDMPEGGDAARRAKVEATRRRILEKAMAKYCFHARPESAPIGFLTTDDRLTGIRFQRTRVVDGRVEPIAGAIDAVSTPLVVSSIGSIPEPMPGIAERGELYAFSDRALGRIAGYDSVFAVGNVVTGKGNILASRKHSIEVTTQVIEQFIGVGPAGHDGEEVLLEAITSPVHGLVENVISWVGGRPRLEDAQVEAILARVRARQRAVGYEGAFRRWVTVHAPKPS